MKRVLGMSVMFIMLAGIGSAAEEAAPFKNQKEKASYVLGMDVGNTLKRQGFDIDMDVFARGARDAVEGKKSVLSDEEMRETINTLRQEVMAKQMAERAKAGEKNKAEGEAFLETNAKKEGVKTLPSGLQYKVLTEGKGKKPAAGDTVTVNYKGTLVDGTEFDSSYKRGQPATFPVKGVIPGWTEALQLMTEGSKWQLVLPAKLAYGENGAGNVIGPNAVLIFEVELISIGEEKKDAADKK